jgi:hypothetical protein
VSHLFDLIGIAELLILFLEGDKNPNKVIVVY